MPSVPPAIFRDENIAVRLTWVSSLTTVATPSGSSSLARPDLAIFDTASINPTCVSKTALNSSPRSSHRLARMINPARSILVSANPTEYWLDLNVSAIAHAGLRVALFTVQPPAPVTVPLEPPPVALDVAGERTSTV